MRFGPREILFLLVLLALPLSSYWFVFRPQNERIDAAEADIEEKDRLLEQLSAAAARAIDLAEVNNEISRGVGLIEARLPSNKEVDVILDQVAALALSNQLTLSRVRTGTPVTAASYMEQPLDMRISGDFRSFYSFLLDLERLDRITRMPMLKISRSDRSRGEIEAAFTLSIYFESGRKGGA